jgi:hypothetical protein
MRRSFAAALLVIMLGVVLGQAVRLGGLQRQVVSEITLHPSRLVAFLHEIRRDSPDTYDSILLNLVRIRDGQALGQELQLEEVVVAEQLLARLAGAAPATAAAASQAAHP